MPSPLEAVSRAKTTRDDARKQNNPAELQRAEQAFRDALQGCRPFYSWAEIGEAAGLSKAGVRWHLDPRMRQSTEASKERRTTP